MADNNVSYLVTPTKHYAEQTTSQYGHLTKTIFVQY